MKKEMQLGLQRKLLRVPVKPLKEWIFFRLLEYGCRSQKGRYPLCQSGLADANRPFYYDVLLVYLSASICDVVVYFTVPESVYFRAYFFFLDP